VRICMHARKFSRAQLFRLFWELIAYVCLSSFLIAFDHAAKTSWRARLNVTATSATAAGCPRRGTLS